MSIEQAVCEVLVETTQQVLWPKLGRWASSYVWPLSCRVGAGKATYYRSRAGSNLIVYGRKMVASKIGGEKKHWLSSKEITQRGYFGGDDNLLNVFAHTACHEFAHLLQVHHRGRRYGSVHNAAFYHYLDDIHSSGLADEVQRDVMARLALRQVSLVEKPSLPTPTAVSSLPTITQGQTILFEDRGKIKEAVVMRVNAKTVSAKPKNTGAGPVYWRVPYGLITAVK